MNMKKPNMIKKLRSTASKFVNFVKFLQTEQKLHFRNETMKNLNNALIMNCAGDCPFCKQRTGSAYIGKNS